MSRSALYLIIAAALVMALITIQAHGGSLLIAANSIALYQNQTVRVTSSGGTPPYYYTTHVYNPSGTLAYSNGTWSVATIARNGTERLYYLQNPTNATRGTLLLKIFSSISNGTSVYLKPQVYDLNWSYINYETHSNVSIFGSGRGTVIRSAYGYPWRMPVIYYAPDLSFPNYPYSNIYGLITPGFNSIISSLTVNGSSTNSTDFELDWNYVTSSLDPAQAVTTIRDVRMNGWVGIYEYQSFNSGVDIYNSTINSSFMGAYVENGRPSGIFDSNITVTGTNALGIRHNECNNQGINQCEGNDSFTIVDTNITTYETTPNTFTTNYWSNAMSWGVLDEGNPSYTNIYGGRISTGGASANGHNQWDLYEATSTYAIMVNSSTAYNAMRVSNDSTECPPTGTYSSALGLCTTTGGYGPYPYAKAPIGLGAASGSQILYLPDMQPSGTWTVDSSALDSSSGQDSNSITFLVGSSTSTTTTSSTTSTSSTSTSSSITTTKPTTTVVSGGGSGGAGSGSGGGSSMPILNLSGSCYLLSNFAVHNSESFAMNSTNFTLLLNFITPTSAGVSVNSKSYTLNQSRIYGIGNVTGYNYTLELSNVSFIPIEHTITLKICSNKNAAPSPKSGNNTTTSTIQESTIATTTVYNTTVETTIINSSCQPNGCNSTSGAGGQRGENETGIAGIITSPLYKVVVTCVILGAAAVIIFFLFYEKSRKPPHLPANPSDVLPP